MQRCVFAVLLFVTIGFINIGIAKASGWDGSLDWDFINNNNIQLWQFPVPPGPLPFSIKFYTDPAEEQEMAIMRFSFKKDASKERIGVEYEIEDSNSIETEGLGKPVIDVDAGTVQWNFTQRQVRRKINDKPFFFLLEFEPLNFGDDDLVLFHYDTSINPNGGYDLSFLYNGVLFAEVLGLQAAQVPIPGSMTLLGSGIVAMLALGRRKKNQI